MRKPSEAEQSMADLADVVNSTLNLINQFNASLTDASHSPAPKLPPDPPNPLDVLHDAAKLLKAQTTKLSLLIMNKPFTPSAISAVIRDLSSTCLPAMMSAVEICQPATHSRILHNEAKARVRRVFKEMEKMMFEVVAASKPDGDGGTRRDSLASTGVVWESCDALMELKQVGLVGLVVHKTEQCRDTIKDAMEELKQWADEEDDEEDADGSGAEEQHPDDIFGAQQRLPKEETELRKDLDASMKKLKVISMLYQALIKRRLKTFTANQSVTQCNEANLKPSHSQNLERLDRLLEALKALPHKVDELAITFYDLDGDSARKILSQCCTLASDAAKLVSLDWTGAHDEFTTWSKKWLEVIDKDE